MRAGHAERSLANQAANPEEVEETRGGDRHRPETEKCRVWVIGHDLAAPSTMAPHDQHFCFLVDSGIHAQMCAGGATVACT